MSKFATLFFAAVLVLCGCGPPAPRDETEAAGRFVEQMKQRKFTTAARQFDGRMASVLPPEKLRELWDLLAKQVGPFQRQLGARTEQQGAYRVVFVTSQFERSLVDVKVVFDSQKRISGLFFGPANQAAGSFTPAPYVNPAAFDERELTVGTGKWALPGTLSMPKGNAPLAAVVLVHGSGPCDRDETVLANKPFRDLAGGLASKGIAVLRYEKRTRAHAAECAALADHFTVQDETIEDAIAAVELLRRTPGVDTNRVFVLGHSLGGMLAPRIGTLETNVAGLILLAAPSSSSIPDKMVAQVTYLLSLNTNGPSPEERKQIDEIKAGAAKVKALTAADANSAAPVLGAPPSYWLDLRGYDPLETAKALNCRLLILHAARDYQVETGDFEKWREALGARTNVTFKLFPSLNHLFVAGEGKSSPQEYEKGGHVAFEVIEQIADWINAKRPSG